MAQFITGDQGSFTFAGAENVVVANFGQWSAVIDRNVFPTTPFGYLTDRVTLGRPRVRGSFVGFFDGDITPKIPENGSTSGTLTLLLKSGKSYSFKARIHSLGIGANSVEGGPIQQQYQFVGSADTNADTITVA
jgi:hypothetical protein